MTTIGKSIAVLLLWGGSAAVLGADISRTADVGLMYPTGRNWIMSSTDEKTAYLIGLGNAINAEFAYQMTSSQPPSDDQTLVQKAHRAFSTYTIDEALDRIDQWYASHPNERGKTVLDVIWLELVKPVSAAARK